MELNLICQYSDLPSPLAYMSPKKEERSELSEMDIDRIIEMAW